jgi:fluoride exporter
MVTLLLVLTGGALGGIVRYWLSGVVARRLGEAFPWGTFAVNVTGALAIGLLAPTLLQDGALAPRALLLTGFLGSYTTVSSFSLQTLALAQGGETARALANIALSLVACLAAAATGYAIAR